MNILENFPLKSLNTFGIDAYSNYFSEFNTTEEAKMLLEEKNIVKEEKLILGGGSNVLFTKNFKGAVLKNNIKGIQLEKETDEYFFVRAGAGENWHHFVTHCIDNNYAGIENLSLIPGNVGASPMQNIGAYGVEIKDVFHELEALNIFSKKIEKFSNADCRFGYRESIFKRKAKGQYIITSVVYRLNKKPIFNTSYGAIEQELKKMSVTELSIKAISQAVCNIRSSKLPDPKEIGNAGSFFKNPVISSTQYDVLKNTYPNIIAHKNTDSEVKLAAGWLIEQCGWKGKRIGNVGMHKDQALVLVNYGEATGRELLTHAAEVQTSVKENFGIVMEAEVNVL